MSSSDSTPSAARSNDATEILQPSHASSASQYAPSDDDSDIIFIDSSDFPPTTSVERNEETYITRAEMVTQIRGFERKLLKVERKTPIEVEALRGEAARLKGLIAQVAIATEDAMMCDVLHASSPKLFALACRHAFSQKALQDLFDATLKSTVEHDPRLPKHMRQPPYTPAAIDRMIQRHIMWDPRCPTCHKRIPAPPREVRKLNDLAKTIREHIAGDLVPRVGVDVNDEPMEGNARQWERLFEIRLRV